MWAFETFPAKIEYTPSGEDRPSYQVEVFGYLHTGCLNRREVDLIVFRQNSFWVAGHDDIGDISLLPKDEFQERFKKFKLVRGK